MDRTIREFIDPDTGKPDDRAWLDDQILTFVTSRTRLDLWEMSEGRTPSRSEKQIYQLMAPTSPKVWSGRPSWEKKNRKVKRQMIAASLRRLIANGKIRIKEEMLPNRKSMHGHDVRERKAWTHLFGPEHDGVYRIYTETNVLEAIAEALRQDST